MVGAQPPQWASRLLLLFLIIEGVVAHLPGFLAAAVATGTALVVLAALWTAGVRTYIWVFMSVLILLPLPPTPTCTTACLPSGFVL